MTTFLFTVSFFGLAMVAMAVGVILSDRQLQGSCGGVGSEDCLCSLEKRRACAKEDLAKRKGDRSVDPAFFGMSQLKAGRSERPDHHGHKH